MLTTALLTVVLLAADPPLGSYITGTPVDAVEQPESKTVVDRLPGESYPLLKRGGPGGAWCKLETPHGEGWWWPRREEPPVSGPAKPRSSVLSGRATAGARPAARWWACSPRRRRS
jgi:hypothetical protein